MNRQGGECRETEERIMELAVKLGSHDSHEAENAVEELIRIGTPAIPAIRGIIENPHMAVLQYDALSGDGHGFPADVFFRRINEAKSRAISFFGGIKNENSLSFLVSLLGDTNEEISNSAIAALTRIGAPAVPLLIPLLNQEEQPEWGDMERIRMRNVSSDAEKTLIKIGPPSVPALLEELKNSSSAPIALHLLGKIGDSSSLPAILELVHTGPTNLKRRAAGTLCDMPLGDVDGLCSLYDDLLQIAKREMEENAELDLADYLKKVYLKWANHLSNEARRRFEEAKPEIPPRLKNRPRKIRRHNSAERMQNTAAKMKAATGGRRA